MKHALLIAVFALFACATAPTSAHAACPPAGYDRARLDALKANSFTIADDAARNAFARALTACLADPDPHLRDEIAFEGFSSMLRHRQLTNETMLALEADLEARMAAPEGPGFERPFAALVMSEIARADRVQAYMTPEIRNRMLDASLRFFSSVHDYRGFDEHDGWRHGVAHGSDLLMQLALNPAFGKPELTRIRDAVGAQIAPARHFYIYGEGERLANPILYIAGRNVFSAEEWAAWIAPIANPAPLANWNAAYTSQAGLARVNDVKAFLFPLYINARLSQAPGLAALLPSVEAAVKALP